MVHLTLTGLSQDKRRLVLVSDAGVEFTLDVDARLRAALRGDTDRLGQLEITMESTLRPRDIQARIRAGASPDDVAQAAQTTVERIMGFVAPVLAERAHVAERAQASSLRRRGDGATAARTLGEAVAAHLRSRSLSPDTVTWDAWRRDDGRWTLTGAFVAGKRRGTATFTFDLRGSYVVADDEDARWLIGEVPDPTSDPVRDDLQQARRRRAAGARSRTADALLDLPYDDSPGGASSSDPSGTTEPSGLGADAVELANDRAGAPPAEGAADADREATVDLGDLDDLRAAVTGAASPEGDLGPSEADRVEAVAEPAGDLQTPDDAPAAPAAPGAPGAPGGVDGRSEPADAEQPAEPEPAPAPRRPARKARGRASVPSWDEIMFGGGRGE
ncbi:septation protein SepH [Nocardioides sp. CPCC 205120]|uniref:septation protein SepH n=1 Tax=Nocardioides sp. CPCC 205120 TaxID=3406462 RepID=UPI003B507D67